MIACLKDKGFKPMTAKASLELLKDSFFPHPNIRRILEMKTLAQLKEEAKKYRVKVSSLKKDDIIGLLLEAKKNPTGEAQPEANSDAEVNKPVEVLLRKSFLRPQSDKPKAAAAIGHRNEEPFLKSFFAEAT